MTLLFESIYPTMFYGTTMTAPCLRFTLLFCRSYVSFYFLATISVMVEDTYVLTDFLTYLLTYLLACLLASFLTYLLTYLLTHLLTYLITYLLTYLLTIAKLIRFYVPSFFPYMFCMFHIDCDFNNVSVFCDFIQNK